MSHTHFPHISEFNSVFTLQMGLGGSHAAMHALLKRQMLGGAPHKAIALAWLCRALDASQARARHIWASPQSVCLTPNPNP